MVHGWYGFAILWHLIAGNTILSCNKATFVSSVVRWHIFVHLNRSGNPLEHLSSDTVYSLGFDFIFFNHMFLLFSFNCSFYSSCFSHCFFLNVFFFLLDLFFFAFSASIFWIILKFASFVIQNDRNTFFSVCNFPLIDWQLYQLFKTHFSSCFKNFLFTIFTIKIKIFS